VRVLEIPTPSWLAYDQAFYGWGPDVFPFAAATFCRSCRQHRNAEHDKKTDYEAFRKMQVYESALAEAQHEGGISDRERALLVRLRDSLGISETDA
jgi:hypothetical protein